MKFFSLIITLSFFLLTLGATRAGAPSGAGGEGDSKKGADAGTAPGSFCHE